MSNPNKGPAYYAGYIVGRVLLLGAAFFVMNQLSRIIPNRVPHRQPNKGGK